MRIHPCFTPPLPLRLTIIMQLSAVAALRRPVLWSCGERTHFSLFHFIKFWKNVSYMLVYNGAKLKVHLASIVFVFVLFLQGLGKVKTKSTGLAETLITFKLIKS